MTSLPAHNQNLPISPITGHQLGAHSNHHELTQPHANNKKSVTLQNLYRSINPEELELKVNHFLNHQLQHSHISSDYQPQLHDEFCICTDCIYSRNLAKPSHSLFNLTLQTVYKQSYTNHSHPNITLILPSNHHHPKPLIENHSSLHPKETVSLQTVYQNMKKDTLPDKTQLFVNEDSLKFQGPFTKLTTYGQKFPGIKGANPYVKPVDKAVRQKFSLNAKTINSTFYRGQISQRPSLIKSPDNIKTGLPLLYKQTTSQKFYQSPSKGSSVLNKHYKSVAKNIETLHDKNQFASTYGKSFDGRDLLETVKHKKRLIRQTMSRLGM